MQDRRHGEWSAGHALHRQSTARFVMGEAADRKPRDPRHRTPAARTTTLRVGFALLARKYYNDYGDGHFGADWPHERQQDMTFILRRRAPTAGRTEEIQCGRRRI